MRRTVGFLVLVAAVGCGHDRSATTAAGGPGQGVGPGRLRELNPAAVGELTQTFRDDPAAAKAKYAETRWRFSGTIQVAGEGGATVNVDGVGECMLVPRPGSGIARLKTGQQSDFAGVLDEFNPAVVGGIKLHDVDMVSRKIRDPKEQQKWESNGE